MENQDNSNPATSKRLWQSVKSIKLSRKARWGLLLGLLIALLASGFIFINSKQNPKQHDISGEADEPKVITQEAPTDEYTKTIMSADKLIITDPAGAIKILEQYAPKVTEPQKLYPIAMRLGDLHYKAGSFNKAITWYEQALKSGQPGSENMYANIGAAAEKTGNKAKAIDAYKKLVELIQKNQTGKIAQQQVEKYQAKIKSLGGS